MASIPTPHVAKIAIIWTYQTSGVKCLNTFYLQDTTDAIFSSPSATLAALVTPITNHLVPVTSDQISYIDLEFEDQRTVPYGGIAIPLSPALTGSDTTTSTVPISAALSVKRATGNLSRTGRGRWYWPIANATHLTGLSTVNATWAASIVSALGNFQTDVEAALSPAVLGIVSKQSNKVARTSGLFQRVTAWGVTDLIVDNQRRRLEGRGT